jgi:hypothetical protein
MSAEPTAGPTAYLRIRAGFHCVRVPGGAQLQVGARIAHLKGASVWELVYRLAGRLDGRSPFEEVIAAAPPSHRGQVETLLRWMIGQGFVHALEEPPPMASIKAEHELLAGLLANHTPRPWSTFERFRTLTLRVYGDGPVARRAVFMLTRLGSGRVAWHGGRGHEDALETICAAAVCRGWAKPRLSAAPIDAPANPDDDEPALCVADAPDVLADLVHAAHSGIRCTVLRQGAEALVGPFVPAGQAMSGDACGALANAWRPGQSLSSHVLDALLAQEVALGVFRNLCGVGHGALEGAALAYEPRSLLRRVVPLHGVVPGRRSSGHRAQEAL